MTRAILLSGPVGSGKTTVLQELGALLEGEPHALIDLDWLAWAQLPPGGSLRDVLARNLSLVCETYRSAGVDRLALARSASAAELSAIRGALAGVELFVVALSVPAPELEARLRARDTADELREHLALAAAFEGPCDALVHNGAAGPAAAAREALALAGW